MAARDVFSLHWIYVIVIRLPFCGIVFNVLSDREEFRICPDHLVIKPLLPDSFSGALCYNTLQLVDDPGDGGIILACGKPQQKMYVIWHHAVANHIHRRIVKRYFKNRLLYQSSQWV